MYRIINRILIFLALAVLIGIVLVSSIPQGQAAFRTLLFLPQVLPAIPAKPLEWVTKEPTRQEIKFTTNSGQGEADLYLPSGSGKHSAVLFFLGVFPPEKRDDPRILGLAEGLARSGMVVMIPWLESQNQERIVPSDIESLINAFQFLSNLKSVDPNRIGIGGICTGASLSLIASQDERIRDKVKFVNFFAGYYNASDMVKAIGIRKKFDENTSSPWTPDKLTLRVFTNHMIEGVTDNEDKSLLTRIFVSNEQWSTEELGDLSQEGLAVYRLLMGVSPTEIDTTMRQLSPSTINFLREISPSTYIGNVNAKVLIMHDRGDDLVPYYESKRLAQALERRFGTEDETYYTEFSLFQKEIQVHEDQGMGVGTTGFIKEASKFFLHMYQILKEAS